MSASLLLVNGPPGIGKSTVARAVVAQRPLALLLEVDALRAAVGQWQQHEASKVIARHLALVVAEAHLRAGHDVVVPQYLGRTDFVVALERVCQAAGAAFVEVVLVDEAEAVVERFRARRAGRSPADVGHPEADVDDDAVEAAVHDALRHLTSLQAARPSTVVVDLRVGVEGAVGDLLDLVGPAR